MLDLSVAVLALFVTFLIVPAFALGVGFAAAIPLFTLGFLLVAWHRRGSSEKRPMNVDYLSSERERRRSLEEERLRHAG